MPDITDDFSHGPYPDDWSRDEIEIWEHSTNTFRELYDGDEYERLQDYFDRGWFQNDLDPDEREQAREDFYDLAGIDPSGFDWESWRAYLGY